jgi:peptide deformylase
MFNDKILLLGDPGLYQVSLPLEKHEVPELEPVIRDMHSTLMDFRAKYGAGRAIAAPQIGILKRLIYIHIDKPLVIINPELSELSPQMMEVWDDCLCFPELFVRVKRHESCKMRFHDEKWKVHEWQLTGYMSELLQHECDHLDGILATQRAIDNKSFKWRGEGK